MKYVTGVGQLTVDFRGAKHTFFRGEALPEQILPYLGEDDKGELATSPTGKPARLKRKRNPSQSKTGTR